MTVNELIEELEYYKDNLGGEAVVYLSTENIKGVHIDYLPQLELGKPFVIDEGELGMEIIEKDVDYIKRTTKK